ncbi:MAG: AMP-binding protein [Motiliproteus sp.]
MTAPRTTCPLAQHALERPEAIALVERLADGQSRLCRYDQLHFQVEQRRHWLQQQGVKPGQHLLLVTHDKAELIRLLIASLRLGCVLIPINPAFPAAQQLELLKRCNADGVIDDSGNVTDCTLLPERCRRLDLNTLAKPPTTSITDQPPIEPIRIGNPQAPLSGVLTSGSTATPKLALHSYRNHAASAEGSRALIPLQPGDGWALALPLYHIGGQATVFRALLAGACLIIPAADESLQQLLREPRLTHLSAVSTQLLRLQHANFSFSDSALRQLLVGGGVIPPALLTWLQQQPVQSWISYGLTEMSSQVMTGPLCPSGRLATLLPHCQLKLSAENEILVKGESLFLGYYRDGQYHRPLDNQGWFNTRDLGQFDARQHLTICGRLDNQFISGGENIQPEMIEQTLAAYPGIAACFVVPVADPRYGQRPVAFISTLSSIDTVQLESWLRQRLPGYLIPIRYLPLPAPTTALKTSRAELIRLAAKLNR